MRLGWLWIDGFRNLNNVTVEFDESRLTTVLIGQNGTGKSNLIEALTAIFRNIDLDEAPPPFSFVLKYQIRGFHVELGGSVGEWRLEIDGKPVTRAQFQKRKTEAFPDVVFGYYSGGNNRLEHLFERHQQRYYQKIIKDQSASRQSLEIEDRRLFYCRPVHGVLALLSCFAFPDKKVMGLLREMLGITGFHSAIITLREPWFAKSQKADSAEQLWGAKGAPGNTARKLLENAFLPLQRDRRVLDDYRGKGSREEQLWIFLRTAEDLKTFAANFQNDLDVFEGLESVDISDLIRWVQVWVNRVDDVTGDVSFGELSDGERQLLAVLALLRLSRNKHALFLLDEPDTHLNPAWQLRYLDLIKSWASAVPERCQLLLSTHNPVTIAALEKEEIRVMSSDDKGKIDVSAPYVDPRGMGFTATLTEIFGLPSTLDAQTQEAIDVRNSLARIDKRTEEQDRQLVEINDKLSRLGFMFEDREPLYQDFLHAMRDVRYANRPPMSPDQVRQRKEIMKQLVQGLMQRKGSPN